VETVRFDMQRLENPEIKGVEYQQGTLYGYEVREYLLEKWGRQCFYCDAREIPLQVEHIVAKSKGGSDRVSNLTLACKKCNQKKGDTDVKVFLKDLPQKHKRLMARAKVPLSDAAAVNSTRLALLERLQGFGLPVEVGSGGQTKFNRSRQGYKKTHWLDAVCVGASGEKVFVDTQQEVLEIRAMGRGSRQMCRVDQYGFPRTKAKARQKSHFGFQTGDLVKAAVPWGKKAGTHIGRVAVRSSGSFNIRTLHATVQGIRHKYCRLLQKIDGYAYNQRKDGASSPL
jgi:hypothetical protein